MSQKSSIDSRMGPLLFGLLFPIIGVVKGLSNPKSESFVLRFSLFYAFLGLALCFSFEDGSDVSRYAANFLYASSKDMSFIDYFHSLLKGAQIDYYLPFMTWLCSRFTSNVHFFFGLLALVNGLFIGNNVYYIAKNSIVNKDTIWLLVLLALVSNPIFIVHRWWTALNVFLFGVIRFLVERKKNYLLVSVLSIFIHFSFIYPVLIIIIVSILPSNINRFLLILFVVFSFIDTLDLTAVSDLIAPYLPDSYVSRTEMYIEFEHAEHNFLSRSTQIFSKILNVILSIVLYFSTKNEKDYPFIKYFNVCLAFGIFSAITGTTEYGWRYFDITNFLFVSLYILTISYFGKSTKWKNIKITFPFYIYIIIYQIRSILEGIGLLSLFFGNYFTIWFFDDNVSVLQLIKWLL